MLAMGVLMAVEDQDVLAVGDQDVLAISVPEN
jgi:hypothetical protein